MRILDIKKSAHDYMYKTAIFFKNLEMVHIVRLTKLVDNFKVADFIIRHKSGRGDEKIETDISAFYHWLFKES